MNPLVYIILVNYKSVQDTIECIKSLEKIKYDNYKIIIVENGSCDNSYELLLDKFPNYIIINSKKNLGFAGGNNLGILEALKYGAEYILLLNNDTIVDENFLNYMILTFKDNPYVGIVTSKINYYSNPNVISYAGGEINWKKFKTNFWRVNEIDNKSENLKNITFASGCCLLIKKQVIEKVGILDESYFMYYEDTDYCARVQEAGYQIIYQPKALIFHKISNSSGGNLSPFVLYWSTKNRIKFSKKFNYKVSKFNMMKFKIFFYTSRIIRIILYLIKFKYKEALAIYKGIIDGIKR